jgi:hypothetical protein
MSRCEQGSTLVFTVSILGLLAVMAAVLAAPAKMAAGRVDMYYRNLQARELSEAGLAQARVWAASGIATNAQFRLGTGDVEIAVEKIAPGQGRVRSIGRVAGAGKKSPVEQRIESTVGWP